MFIHEGDAVRLEKRITRQGIEQVAEPTRGRVFDVDHGYEQDPLVYVMWDDDARPYPNINWGAYPASHLARIEEQAQAA